jgi:hypothetical protein
MQTKLKLLFAIILLNTIMACSSNGDAKRGFISWGYTVGDPILYEAGHTGNFHPYASPYGQEHYIVYEGEGAAAP